MFNPFLMLKILQLQKATVGDISIVQIKAVFDYLDKSNNFIRENRSQSEISTKSSQSLASLRSSDSTQENALKWDIPKMNGVNKGDKQNCVKKVDQPVTTTACLTKVKYTKKCSYFIITPHCMAIAAGIGIIAFILYRYTR